LRIIGGALTIQNGLPIIRKSAKRSAFSKATYHCPNGLSFWMAAAALPLTFYHGSQSKMSA
jgi:hypothetical protein